MSLAKNAKVEHQAHEPSLMALLGALFGLFAGVHVAQAFSPAQSGKRRRHAVGRFFEADELDDGITRRAWRKRSYGSATSDLEALARDWTAVGRDMRRGIERERIRQLAKAKAPLVQP